MKYLAYAVCFSAGLAAAVYLAVLQCYGLAFITIVLTGCLTFESRT
jgi:hypothetical protein